MESALSESTALLRHEPVQARSNARLSSLLDAAAATIGDVGYERLTTAMVAERAGASIGTVYRYFPDRIAVLQGVAARESERFIEGIVVSLSSSDPSQWWAAVDTVIDELVQAFTHRPAFASLRFGDVLDLRPREGLHTGIGSMCERIAPLLSMRHGLPAGQELTFHLNVIFTVIDSLLARAFVFSRKGDAAYIEQARSLAHSYLVHLYGEPSTAR